MQNPFPLNGAKPVYTRWTLSVNTVFSIYTVLLIVKGIGITKPDFLMLHNRTCTVFLSADAIPALLTSQCWLQKVIFTRENIVLTFYIHLISALFNGISSSAARCEIDFLSLLRIKQTSLHQYQIIKQPPGTLSFYCLVSLHPNDSKAKWFCFAIKPVSISSLLFSSGEWNHGPHLELISIDQVIVPRQLLFVKLQCNKWDLNFKAVTQGCCVRERAAGNLCCCPGREAGRGVQGSCPGSWPYYPGTWMEEGRLP